MPMADGNQAADQADAQRNAAAVEQTGEHVATDAVRAQNVLGAGGAVLVNHAIFLVVLCQRVVGADFVRKYCQQNQHKEDDEADDRQLVAAEFLRRAPHVLSPLTARTVFWRMVIPPFLWIRECVGLPRCRACQAMKLPSSTSTAVIRFSAISSEYSRAVMAFEPSVPKPAS